MHFPLNFKLVTQVVCTKESSTFTAKMDIVYSHMQETSDSFQAKERKLLLITDGLQGDLEHSVVIMHHLLFHKMTK